MSEKRQALGRGLSALIPDAPAAQPVRDASLEVDLDLLTPNRFQPRVMFDDVRLQELADSIKTNGIIQPIVVRRRGAQYEIIAGERRWRAAQRAGILRVPVVVREVADDNLLQVALIENIQREDLNPVEEAAALQRLIDEFGMTHQRVAEAVGRSRAAVTNLLRLLSLSDEVRRMLEDGRMDMGHARALLALEGVSQTKAAQDVVDRRLSVRETEELVRRLLERPATRKGKHAVDNDVRDLQQKLAEKLGAKVRIQHARGGKGQFTVYYNSLDELDGILQRIR